MKTPRTPRLIPTTAVALLLAGVLGTTVGAGAATTPARRGRTASQVVALALAGLRAAGSYTVTVASTVQNFSATSVTSSTLTSGIRHDVINGQHGERIFAQGVVYVRFTPVLEQLYFAKVIPGLANQWVAFRPGQRYFSVFAATMTGSTLAPLITPSGRLTMSAALTYDGQRVVAVTGTPPTTTGLLETLYVSDRAPYRPVAVRIDSRTATSTTLAETITFSHWGAHLRVSAPAHSVASSQFTLP